LIKIIGILILQLTLSLLLFSSLLLSRTFFAIPRAEKMHPFFLPVINPKSILPLFPLLQFLFLFNEYANYLYQKIETTLLTLFGRILGFIEGKGRQRA
jgi:hypothetical protein